MILYVYSIHSSKSTKTKIEYIKKKLKEIYSNYSVINYDELNHIDLNTVKILIFSGGDGVFNQIINKCVNFKHIIFGYIPLGTANDIAHNLNINTIEKSIQVIRNGYIKEINLITINDKYFMYALSIGPLGIVTAFKNVSMKKKFSKIVYKIEGIKHMFCKRKEVKYEINGVKCSMKLKTLLILRTKYLGGVRIDNMVSPYLKIVTVKNIFDLIKIFIFKKTNGIQARSLYVESSSIWSIDGEKIDTNKAVISISENKIKLLSKNA